MIAAQAVQLAVVAALAVATTARLTSIGLLCATAFALGAAETVFRSSAEAMLPAVVAPQHRMVANGRQQASMFIADQSLGPPVGAALFAVASSLPFWVDAATFAASLVLIAGIRPRPAFAPPRSAASPLADLKQGAHWLLGHPVVRSLTGLAAVANFTTFMTLSTFVLFAEQELHLSVRGYGLMLGLTAVGGSLGALASNRLVRRYGLVATLAVVPFVAPVAFLLVGTVGRSAVLVGVLVAASGAALAVWNVISFSLRQQLVPGALLGRVGGAARMVSFGAGPLGSLAGGVVAAHWGLAAPWLVAGAIRLAVNAAAVPMLRRQRHLLDVGAAPVHS